MLKTLKIALSVYTQKSERQSRDSVLTYNIYIALHYFPPVSESFSEIFQHVRKTIFLLWTKANTKAD